MFRFHEKMLMEAQEEEQEKGKLESLRLCLLHLLCQGGCFQGEIRAVALPLGCELVLA